MSSWGLKIPYPSNPYMPIPFCCEFEVIEIHTNSFANIQLSNTLFSRTFRIGEKGHYKIICDENGYAAYFNHSISPYVTYSSEMTSTKVAMVIATDDTSFKYFDFEIYEIQ